MTSPGQRTKWWWRALVCSAALLASAAARAAITFDPTPSSGSAVSTQLELIQDAATPAIAGSYLGLRMSSSTPLSNVYARATVGGVGFTLDATETQDHFIGDLSASAKTSYWYINYPATGSGTLQVQIYVGDPNAGGVLQGTSTAYTVSSANADQGAAANKINSVTLTPSTVQIGQNFNVIVCYTVNSTARLLLGPAVTSSFDPAALRLGNVVVDAYASSDCTGLPSSTLSNQLLFTSVNSNSVRATYTFQAVSASSSLLSPIVSARSGVYKYSTDFSSPPAGVSYVVPAPTNAVTLAKSVDISSSAVGNITVTYSVTASNAGTSAATLDQIIDNLPASPANASYVANSTRVNGVAQSSFNPVTVGQQLTWNSSGTAGTTFNVPALGTLTLSYSVVLPAVDGIYTNSAIGKISGAQIDTTADLGNAAPASASTRIGQPALSVSKLSTTPTIVNTALGSSAGYTVSVTNNGGSAAAGVVLTDALPSGLSFAAQSAPVLAGGATRSSTSDPSAGATSLAWGVFNLPAGASVSISFSVNVAASVPDGVVNNSASASTTSSPASIVPFDGSASATDNVNVTSAVLSTLKSTLVATVYNGGSGGSTGYEIVVSNSGTAAATAVKVTDALPANFSYSATSSVIVNGSASSSYQVTGGSSTPVWDSNPSLGFTINAGQSLRITFTAAVAAATTAGVYSNSAAASGNARSSAAFDGTTSTADDVTVVIAAAPSVTKTFTPAVIAAVANATLQIVISNANNFALTGAAFTDNYPATLANVSAAAFSAASTLAGCTGSISGGAGATSLALSGATIPALSSCELVVSVTSSSAGPILLTNPAFAVSAANAPSGSALSAVLQILAKPGLVKSFAPNRVALGDTATLSLVLSNPNPVAISALALSDTFPSGLRVAAVPAAQNACGGVFAPLADDASISLSGGSLAAGQSCTLSVAVSGAAAGSYSNTASGVSSTETGAAGTPSNTAVLTIDPPPGAGVRLSGVVYNDVNHSLQRDSAEAGTGLVLYAKLLSADALAGPALQAVLVDAVTGQYEFSGVAPGSYQVIIDNNAVLADATPAIPNTWTATEGGDLLRRDAHVASVDLGNVHFGLFNGNLVTGRVFRDNGSGGGMPNNALQEGLESGIAGVTLRLMNAAGTLMLDSTRSDAVGNYRLWVPVTAAGTVLQVVEDNLSGDRSVGGIPSVSYDRVADAHSFTYNAGSPTADLNFADVALETWASNQQKAGLPGSVLFYAHRFTPGTGGSVAFNASSNTAWPQALLLDGNCNGQFDAGEGNVSAPMAATAGAPICIVLRVTVPAGVTAGAQSLSTVSAVFTAANASPAWVATLSNEDLSTAAGAGLMLVKSQDNATPLPGGRIIYTLSFTNLGSTGLSGLRINDATPAHTRFVSAACGLPLAGGISTCSVSLTPAVNGTGAIEWLLSGVLSPGASGSVSFVVDVAGP